MTVWFTADQHFGHANILSFMKRPFAGLHDMHDSMIRAWQERVMPGDRVYVLGDFIWKADPGYILRQLPGELYLLVGNHDRRKVYKHDRWVWAKDLVDLQVEGQRLVLCHYPLASWRKQTWGAWMLHGHCHQNLSHELDNKKNRFDVGVDGHPEFAPWSFEEIKAKLEGDSNGDRIDAEQPKL